MNLRRIPASYAVLFVLLAALGTLVALVWFDVVDVTPVFFALANVVLLTLLFVFAVLGGAFAGMLMTHRLLANREFTPGERALLEIQAELKAINKRLGTLEERLPEREPPRKSA